VADGDYPGETPKTPSYEAVKVAASAPLWASLTAVNRSQEDTVEKAMFGAGCFWGIEAAFRDVPGVLEVTSGYSGGERPAPSYENVCSGDTGHAEVVEIDFDPDRVSYGALLEKFWELHDPTTPNRQGPDVGTQYRSAIFFHSPEQEAAAIASRDEAQTRSSRPIVTEITPAADFWRAEEYHQRYFERQGGRRSLLF
jgi:peptide-methionine (S)-S-oxide reductase